MVAREEYLPAPARTPQRYRWGHAQKRQNYRDRARSHVEAELLQPALPAHPCYRFLWIDIFCRCRRVDRNDDSAMPGSTASRHHRAARFRVRHLSDGCRSSQRATRRLSKCAPIIFSQYVLQSQNEEALPPHYYTPQRAPTCYGQMILAAPFEQYVIAKSSPVPRPVPASEVQASFRAVADRRTSGTTFLI